MIQNDPGNPYYNFLVLGNGFDLSLGLKSSFSSFLKQETIDENGLFREEEKNLLLFLLYLRFLSNDDPDGKLLFRPVYKGDPNWMDVEGFIKKIATDPDMLDGIYKAMSFRIERGVVSGRVDLYVWRIGQFLIKLDLPKKKFDKGTIKSLLAKDLSDFERRFSKYLLGLLRDRDEHSRKQAALVEHIMTVASKVISKCNLEVINFNYTKNSLGLYGEVNVHGSIDNKIVIGYDSTQKAVAESDIFELSKDWRKIDVDFFEDSLGDFVDSIVVYGHSLGEQDYPLFFELFDKCHLLEEKYQAKLVICYSVWDEGEECKKALESLKMNAAKLLNAYERYLHPEIARNTIVTKLKFQGRLIFAKI